MDFKWELKISYNLQSAKLGADGLFILDRVACILVGRKHLASGGGGTQRDMHFYFESEEAAKVAERRLKLDGRYKIHRCAQLQK